MSLDITFMQIDSLFWSISDLRMLSLVENNCERYAAALYANTNTASLYRQVVIQYNLVTSATGIILRQL